MLVVFVELELINVVETLRHSPLVTSDRISPDIVTLADSLPASAVFQTGKVPTPTNYSKFCIKVNKNKFKPKSNQIIGVCTGCQIQCVIDSVITKVDIGIIGSVHRCDWINAS